MTGRDVLAEVRRLAAESAEIDVDLAPESRLVEDLGLDSLRLQGLAIEVENHFRIRLDAEDDESIATVSDLVETIERKLKERR